MIIVLSHVKHRGLVQVLLLIVACIAWSTASLYSQQPLAQVILRPMLDPRPDTATFELWLKKLDPQWDYVANGTFRMEIPEMSVTGGISAVTHIFEYEPGSSGLTPLGGYVPANVQTYHISTEIINQRMSVMTLNPDSVFDCVTVRNVGDSILIGRFLLATRDGSFFADTVAFITDTRQLTVAFKIDHDSVTGVGTTRNVWYQRHDNVPFGSNAEFISEPPPPDLCNGVFDFKGTYLGDLLVALGFDVTDEHCFFGYWIERALVDQNDPTNLAFQLLPPLHYNANVSLRSCRCLRPQSRSGYLDTVQYRREQYAYRLMGEFQPYYGGDTIPIDTIFIRIPNAVLSNAVLLENPFQDKAVVSFNCDDRLILTGSVFDLGGRLIAHLVDEQGVPIINKPYPKGVGYRAIFNATAMASQGLYNIILVGIPVSDDSIEQQSRVVLKGQLIR